MAELPKVGTDLIDVNRGSGALATKFDYLKNVDPNTYYYEKFKSQQNKYLLDEMWSEAAKRGETPAYIDLIARRSLDDKKRLTSVSGEDTTKTEETDWLAKWNEYTGYTDYDSYMLSLSMPYLDDTEKLDWTYGDVNYGQFTQKEWAEKILQSSFEKYEAAILEDQKANQNFLVKLNGYLGSITSRLLAGVTSGVRDLLNIAEGLLDVVFDFSGSDYFSDIGERFLHASADDELGEGGVLSSLFNQFTKDLEDIAFDYEKEYAWGLWDAEKAYESGYSPDSEEYKSAGYTTGGKWLTGGVQSIGYMLPSMLLTWGLSATVGAGSATGYTAAKAGSIVTKGLSTRTIANIGKGVFYAQIFSGNIKDTIDSASKIGLTYKDLNAGEVISNALIKAGAQLAVEELLGKIIGWSFTDRAIRGGMAAAKVAKVGATEAKALGIAALNLAKSSVKEGLEEVLQDMSDALVDHVYSRFGTNLSEIYQSGVEQKMSIENLVDSFVVGALTDVTIGTLKNMKYISPKNRVIGEDADGKAYKMGAFQTMNYVEALRTMNEWNDVIKDHKSSFDDKADAAMKLSIATNQLSSLFKSMGDERIIKANNILVGYLNDEAKKEEVKRLSQGGYATNLFATFNEQYKKVVDKYNQQVIQAFKDKQKKLQDANVTKASSVVCKEATTENTDIDKTSLDTISKLLDESGIKVVVGVDGNITTQSGDILIVPDELLRSGDLPTIIQGASYDKVREEVRKALNANQRKMITEQYNTLTHTTGTIDDALNALLFDKKFYAKILLLSAERTYTQKSIDILTTIDGVVKQAANELSKKGGLTTKAYNTLLNKVKSNMTAGLVLYATEYAKLDLDNISNDILSKETKQAIRNHPNVIFTNVVDTGIENAKNNVIDNKEVQRYSFYLQKFNDKLTSQQVTALTNEITSTKATDRLDAWASLLFLCKCNNDSAYNKTKLVYLGNEKYIKDIANHEAVVKLESIFGTNLETLAKGDFDILDFDDEVKEVLMSTGMTPQLFVNDTMARNICLRELIFEMSDGTLTLDTNFNLTQVIDKFDFMQDKYLGEDGDKQFIADVKKGKLTIGDIVKDDVKIPKIIKQLKLVYSTELTNIKSSGRYIEGNDYIEIGVTGNTNVLMHELTHVTQYLIAKDSNSKNIVTGGTNEIFKGMVYSEADRLNKDLAKHFPVTYSLVRDKNMRNTFADVAYFLLQGEIEANLAVDLFIPEIGFTYSKDKRTLIAPYKEKGKQVTYSLTQAKIKGNITIPEMIKDVSYDRTITETTEYQITDSEKIAKLNEHVASMTEEQKQEAIKRVNNITLYKGAPSGITEFDNTKGEKKRIVKGAIWLTDNRSASETYRNKVAGDNIYTLKANISNPLVIDAKGKVFSQIEGKLTSDDITSYAKQNGYDSVVIDNVIDVGPRLAEDQKAAIKPSTDIVLLNGKSQYSIEDTSLSKQYGEPYTKQKGTFKKEGAGYSEEQKESQKEYFATRYISNSYAKNSNLKYFITKGKPIMLDRGTANFVESTTEGFDNLPIVLKDKITNGTLTYQGILDYVATANNIDDYTFKAIAKNVFNNNDLAKLSFKEMRYLADNITDIAVLSYLTDDYNEKMSVKEMKQLKKDIDSKVDGDPQLSKKYLDANKYASTVIVDNKHIESFADPDQLNTLFFRLYNGTLSSIRSINNIGKFVTLKQSADTLIENSEDGNIEGIQGQNNYIDRMKKSTVKYDYTQALSDDTITDSLADIDYAEKIETITQSIEASVIRQIKAKSPQEQAKYTPAKIQAYINSKIDALYNLSDDELDARYLKVIEKNKLTNKEVQQITSSNTELTKKLERTKAGERSALEKKASKNIDRLMVKLSGLKKKYDSLPTIIKPYIERLTNGRFKNVSNFTDLTNEQLSALNTELLEANQKLKSDIQASERSKSRVKVQERIIEKLTKQVSQLQEKVSKDEIKAKKSLREKIQPQFKTTITEQKFSFKSNTKITGTGASLLDTAWDKTRKSTVQGLGENVESNVANADTFFEQNSNTLLASDLTDCENTVDWFLNAEGVNMTSSEFKKFDAVKMMYLGWVISETKLGGMYQDMNRNLVQKVENYMQTEISTGMRRGAIWNAMLNKFSPLRSMQNADIVMDGVTLGKEQKDILFKAIESNDMEKIRQAQKDIIEWVEANSLKKKSLGRRITSLRSMSMLSSPITWLRNKVSNFVIKPLNKLSSAIGNRIFSKRTFQGQLKLDANFSVKLDKNGKPIFKGNISPEIQNFITTNFIDNGMFDVLVNNISKYNPSDIDEKYKDARGKAEKEAIMSQLVLKSMYNEYYNKNMFKTKAANDVHNFLMKMMSDDKYIREASVRYFGKILAERGYDNKVFTDNNVNDNVMNDFAMSLGLAMRDYMHSDNFFNSFEKAIAERSEVGLFVYKTFLPYASASWNWFKAAINLGPLGLVKSIVDFARLEKRIQKAEVLWQDKKSQLSPELTEYITRRNLGQGVIGTILWGLGLLLAGTGHIRLKEDDYGTPKLIVGNLVIDVSQIFGSSSLLAGAALIEGWKNKGIIGGLDAMTDFALNDMPLMEIVEMDMYSNGGFSMGLDQLESIALSYIPNGLAWLASITYSGNVKTENILQRAAKKIPFMGNLLEKKVDPYTGSKGSMIDALNRFVPYFSINTASQNERKTNELGLNKTQLRGSYEINGTSFNVRGKDLTFLNESYGKWNAADLSAFYSNQMRVKIKVDNTYRELTHDQMTREQQKKAVQTIMSNNAEIAKIQAWILAGHKYYASAEMYSKLRKLGITSNVYRGTKGFVE